MTATSSGGTPLILSILALVVSLVVGMGAVLMARVNVQRQIRATARETWMREFRQHAAELLRNHGLRPGEGTREFEIRVAMRFSYHAMRLLVAERAPEYDGFIPDLDNMMRYQGGDDEEFTAAAAAILRRERAAILGDRGVWREIGISLGFTRLRSPDLP